MGVPIWRINRTKPKTPDLAISDENCAVLACLTQRRILFHDGHRINSCSAASGRCRSPGEDRNLRRTESRPRIRLDPPTKLCKGNITPTRIAAGHSVTASGLLCVVKSNGASNKHDQWLMHLRGLTPSASEMQWKLPVVVQGSGR